MKALFHCGESASLEEQSLKKQAWQCIQGRRVRSSAVTHMCDIKKKKKKKQTHQKKSTREFMATVYVCGEGSFLGFCNNERACLMKAVSTKHSLSQLLLFGGGGDWGSFSASLCWGQAASLAFIEEYKVGGKGDLGRNVGDRDWRILGSGREGHGGNWCGCDIFPLLIAFEPE